MKTRSVICGSMMVLLAACSGSSEEGSDNGGSQASTPAAANESAKAPAPAAPAPSENDAPGAPPAEDAPPPPAGPAAIAPTITSLLPADGSSGADVSPIVTVAFSRSMDRASTEAAFSLVGGAPMTGSFGWADDDKLLTFTPSGSAGNGTAMTAKIAVGAKDREGTNLAAPVVSNFLTMRKTTVEIASETVVQCTSVAQNVYFGQFFVGDDAANIETRSFATFDLSSLPEDMVTLESATLQLHNRAVVGKTLSFVAESVDYGASLSCTGDFAGAPRTFYNPFTKTNQPIRATFAKVSDSLDSANVALGVAMDWKDRQLLGKRSMFRFQTEAAPPKDASSDGMRWDGAASKATAPTLIVTYEHP